jgi:intein/homing endonuclease
MDKIPGFKVREFKDKNYRALFNKRTGQTLRIALDPKKPIGSLQYPELLDVSFGTKCLANCFVPSTKIYTANGIKQISEIKVNDEVFSYDDSIDDFVKEIVYETFEEDYDGDIIVIELEDGVIIRSTPNHEFLTQRGWINAGNITEEDDIKAMRNM